MEGKRNLSLLPDSLKSLIASKYGSLEQFYDFVYNAGKEYYKAFVIEKDTNKIKAIDESRFNVAIELERMARSIGLDIDGADIYDSITGDFDEDLVKSKYGLKL